MAKKTSDARVVVVCMVDSIHSARWLENYKDKGIDFHLYPSTPNRRVHPQIKQLLTNSERTSSTYTLNSLSRWLAIPMWCADMLLGNRARGYVVSQMTKKNTATHLHAMELNHSGKISAQALKKLTDIRPKVVSTVWGSDIFWFGRFAKHQGYLTEILKGTDLLISECARDLVLARDLGFNGKFEKSESLFGFADSQIQKEQTLTSQRNLILIKGYESFVGRASIALRAVEALSEELKQFEIHVYSTTWKTRKIIRKYNKNAERKIIFYKKNSLNSAQMLELFERARVHLGISLSDGVPASMLESIVTGAFPIQTNTACCEGWLVHQESGLLVSAQLDEVVAALSIAIQDDDLVDRAMEINHQTAIAKLSQSLVAKRISGMNLYQ
jgi:glycosyltransferase involved in cell wall biosynthesis